MKFPGKFTFFIKYKDIFNNIKYSILALLLVFISFSMAIGFRETYYSLITGITNFHLVFDGIKKPYDNLIIGSAVKGEADNKYQDLDLSNYYVKPIKIQTVVSAPLLIPTDGIAGHKDFIYDPVIHPGVDIWSQVNGKGIFSNQRGYKVISACSGTVGRIFHPNEEIEIYCDKLSDEYKDKVPSLNIKILYSHMGDAVTKEPFHNLHIGQRLDRGEFIGYQGALSSFAPANRVVHLHFGVYNLKTRKPIDPTSYIGVSATSVGQMFRMEVE